MKKRSAYFDNVRFFLIFFVVFGHFLRPYVEEAPLFYALYMTIYSFHMPAFIFVSGFFAKGILRDGYLKKVAVKLLVPLLCFQLLYSLFYFWIEHDDKWHVSLLIPEWSLWFLLSLFFWHALLLWTIKWHRPKLSFLIAVLAGLFIGAIPEPLTVFSIGRTIVFFPFFLAGYYVQKDWLNPLFSKKVRAVLFAAGLSVFFFLLFVPPIRIEWLFGSYSFASLDVTVLKGILGRSAVYGLHIVMILVCLSFVPRRSFFFTNWGQNTLYVYLLHGFFVQSTRRVEWLELPPSILWLFSLSAALTLLLASPVTASLFKPFLELKKPAFLQKKEGK